MEVKQGEGENDHYLRIKAISMLDQFYSSTHPYIHSSCHWCQDWWSLWLSIYNCTVVNGKRFMATSHNGFFFFKKLDSDVMNMLHYWGSYEQVSQGKRSVLMRSNIKLW